MKVLGPYWVLALAVFGTVAQAEPCVTSTFDVPFPGAQDVELRYVDVPSVYYPSVWQEGYASGYFYRLFPNGDGFLAQSDGDHGWRIDFQCDFSSRSCVYDLSGAEPEQARAIAESMGQCLLGPADEVVAVVSPKKKTVDNPGVVASSHGADAADERPPAEKPKPAAKPKPAEKPKAVAPKTDSKAAKPEPKKGVVAFGPPAPPKASPKGKAGMFGPPAPPKVDAKAVAKLAPTAPPKAGAKLAAAAPAKAGASKFGPPAPPKVDEKAGAKFGPPAPPKAGAKLAAVAPAKAGASKFGPPAPPKVAEKPAVKLAPTAPAKVAEKAGAKPAAKSAPPSLAKPGVKEAGKVVAGKPAEGIGTGAVAAKVVPKAAAPAKVLIGGKAAVSTGVVGKVGAATRILVLNPALATVSQKPRAAQGGKGGGGVPKGGGRYPVAPKQDPLKPNVPQQPAPQGVARPVVTEVARDTFGQGDYVASIPRSTADRAKAGPAILPPGNCGLALIPASTAEITLQMLLVNAGQAIVIDGKIGPSTRRNLALVLGKEAASLSVEDAIVQLDAALCRTSQPQQAVAAPVAQTCVPSGAP